MDSALPTEKREANLDEILKRLLLEKGIFKYALISADEEASKILPGGMYPVSGTILTLEGKIYCFWLEWDEKKNDYTLGDDYWREINQPDEDKEPWLYQAIQKAKKELGIEYPT